MVLGRSQSGKTVFSARLYEQLWTRRVPDIHMRALDGAPHVWLMGIIESMRAGNWPVATQRQDYVDVAIEYANHTFRLTLLDYPGESFKKAFLDGRVDETDTRELVEHIDRAAGVILLIDPKNAVDTRDVGRHAEDDFAMQQALRRIRSFPGGRHVPVAIVLTKCDLRWPMVKSLGGLSEFFKKYLSNVVAAAQDTFYCFPAIAAYSKPSRRSDRPVPDVDRPPVYVAEPLKWVLKMVIEAELRELRRKEGEERPRRIEQKARAALAEAKDKSKSLRDRIATTHQLIEEALAEEGAADHEILREAQLHLEMLKRDYELDGDPEPTGVTLLRFLMVFGLVIVVLGTLMGLAILLFNVFRG